MDNKEEQNIESLTNSNIDKENNKKDIILSKINLDYP